MRIRRWPVSAVLVSTAMAGALVVTSGSVAEAKRLITGRDIATNTITGKNIKDGSLTASDFGATLPQGAPGSQGAQGAPGQKGDQGPTGPGIPEKVYTWTATFTADGSYGSCTTGGATNFCTFPGPALVTSTQTLPADSYVRLIHATLSGLATCDGQGASIYFLAGGQSLGATSSPYTDTPISAPHLTTSPDEHLAVAGGCQDGTTLDYKPIPSFTATVTFSVVKASDMGTTVFN